jgi:hypothetical protein
VIHAPAAAVKHFVVLIYFWVNGNKLAPSSRAAVGERAAALEKLGISTVQQLMSKMMQRSKEPA